jgi:hypothetical protein
MHAAKSELTSQSLGDAYEGWLAKWGPYTAYFERIAAGVDFTAYYDSCQCPHWGYVFKGKLRFVYTDGREEIVSSGQAYYVPAGHTFYVLEDAETIEFSPTREYDEHMEIVARNIEANSPAAE